MKYIWPNVFSEIKLEESIEKHDTLNPKLWNKNKTLKPEVTSKIRNLVGEFLNELAEDGVKIFVDDIILVGSNCSYNYTKDSDLDVHIIANTKNLTCPDDLYTKLYSAYRTIFNKKFDISFYDIPVELYVETDEMPRISNGCYSVVSQRWLSEPSLSDIPEVDQATIDKVFQEWDNRYKTLIQKIENSENYQESTVEVEKYIEDIYNLRKTSLPTEGEYGLGNLIFKEVRNCGYLDALKELRNELLSKAFSLESLQAEKLTEEILEPQEPNYEQLILRNTGKLPIIHPNGMFEIYNVQENEVNRICTILQTMPVVQWVNKNQTRFVVNPANLNGLPLKIYRIYGQLNK